MGVNLGRLGFLTEVPVPEMVRTLDEILAGNEALISPRLMLEAARDGERWLCLNDIVINKGALARMLHIGHPHRRRGHRRGPRRRADRLDPDRLHGLHAERRGADHPAAASGHPADPHLPPHPDLPPHGHLGPGPRGASGRRPPKRPF